MSLPWPIEEAVKNGLYLEVAGGNLRYRGPKGLVIQVLPLLKAHKSEILAYLRRAANEQTGAEEVSEAVRESVGERAAILEYEAGFSRDEADQTAEYCRDFYTHLFGPGKANNCCYAPADRYCEEGRRLRDRYYEAVKRRGWN